MRSLFLSILVAFVAATVPARADMILIMAEEDGCYWCAKWNEEIGPIYPKTTEGKIAPLRRIDIHADAPDDLTFDKQLHFTPTFVLMKDGIELNRIEGYPGEDFFWGLLGVMIEQAEQAALTDG